MLPPTWQVWRATCWMSVPHDAKDNARFGPEDSMPSLPIPVITIGLLLASNIFMTFAWYGHLKYKTTALVTVILVSWGIAFFEYCLAVPANRIGHQVYSAAQLKTIQEVITLTVFVAFSVFFLKESISWQVVLGFALIAVGASLVFFAPGTAPVAVAAPAPAAQVGTE